MTTLVEGATFSPPWQKSQQVSTSSFKVPTTNKHGIQLTLLQYNICTVYCLLSLRPSVHTYVGIFRKAFFPASPYTLTVSYSDLTTQKNKQGCQVMSSAKPRGGSITSERRDTLASWKLEEKQEWHIIRNGKQQWCDTRGESCVD